ncbi:MAG TPA: protease pro-enzyme activation domain-containing protein, partial [Chthonomonadaceae bacterium]|nr:protease pro-enzyme activation domain-containing protein [Chthonomonadaceae bacterium]
MQTANVKSILTIAAVSAALLALLGGLSAASAQSSSPSGKAAATARTAAGSPFVQPVPLAERNKLSGAPRGLTVLPPVPNRKHPIPAPVTLADPSVLAGPRVALTGHLPGLLAHASKLTPVDPGKMMTLGFALQPRNKAQMDDLAHRLYDSNDPLFHHFLKPAERIARFSPSVEDFNKVVAFAQQNGLKVTDSTVDRQLLTAVGTAAQIETALGVHLDHYQTGDGRSFYAPDSDPKAPAGIAPLIASIAGLSDASQARADSPHVALAPGAGPGSSGGATPDFNWQGTGMPAAEITNCYNLSFTLYNSGNPVAINGSGQRVALVEGGNFYAPDIAAYISYNATANPPANLSAIPLQVRGDGAPINNFTQECELDIEMLEAVADGLDAVDVYEEDPTAYPAPYWLWLDMEHIVNDDVDNQVSISYIADEYTAGSSTTGFFAYQSELMALQGQAVFASSGDYGAYNGEPVPTVSCIASSPWVTGVGGTSLSTDSAGNYSSESVWNDGAGATGGGESVYNPIPNYQYFYLLNNSASQGSPISFAYRNVPDVALDADPYTGYYAYLAGQALEVGGTSAATPIWAGAWAQLNQWRALYGQSQPMGFPNPALYSIAQTANYPFAFHDITSGNNGYYNAESGYDGCTGLGSLNGYNLELDLVDGYSAWPANESLTSSVSSVICGQPFQMILDLNPSVPQSYQALVYLYQVVNGQRTYVTGGTYSAGTNEGALTLTAPHVSASTNATYIAAVTYQNTITSKNLGTFWTNQASVQVNPIALSSLSASPDTAYDGQSVIGTITLNAPADQSEKVDLVSSDPRHVIVPASVTVPQGAQTFSFTINTAAVSATEQVTLTAQPDSASALGQGSVSASLTITPLLSSVKVSPASVTGGQNATGTIHLLAPAPSNGAVITLKSSNAAASVPASITIPAGATSATFPITTSAVSALVSVKISATHGAAVKTTNLKVEPIGVSSLTLTPSTVVGGNSV